MRFPGSWSSTFLANKRCQKHRQDIFVLDTAFALIEGHPVLAELDGILRLGQPPFFAGERLFEEFDTDLNVLRRLDLKTPSLRRSLHCESFAFIRVGVIAVGSGAKRHFGEACFASNRKRFCTCCFLTKRTTIPGVIFAEPLFSTPTV